MQVRPGMICSRCLINTERLLIFVSLKIEEITVSRAKDWVIRIPTSVVLSKKQSFYIGRTINGDFHHVFGVGLNRSSSSFLCNLSSYRHNRPIDECKHLLTNRRRWTIGKKAHLTYMGK